MRIVPIFIIFACTTAILCSCSNAKKVLYFQDIETKKQLEAFQNYEPLIKKDDLLSIIVSGPNKDVTMPYNLTLGENALNTSSTISYLVDAEGYISFPILGKIHVEGMTRRQLEDYLTYRISKDVKNPIVVISFQNYRVTILGEVNSPGTYTMPSEKTTILQALGMAGDLAISGKRSDILLLREKDGNFEYTKIDLRRTDILTSPEYYLCQNDVIYVSPISSRISSGTSPTATASLIFSSLGMILTLVTFFIRTK